MTHTTTESLTPLHPSEEAAFREMVQTAFGNRELVAQFNRLHGTNLGATDSRTPMERAIDEATGHDPERQPEAQEDMLSFVQFCREYIWQPLMDGQPATH